MNRFTKEVRKLGYKIESDYDTLPCGNIETAYCKADRACYYVFHYCMGLVTYKFDRAMECSVIYEDDENPRF